MGRQMRYMSAFEIGKKKEIRWWWWGEDDPPPSVWPRPKLLQKPGLVKL